MLLVINLSKEVPDAETGQILTDIVVDRLSDHPEVRIDAHCSKKLNGHEVPPT